jgi:(p)ppGpp synthase/HD superfamily hydrolase
VRPTERFDEAVAFARRLHDGQKRKATDIPYLTHLLAVAGLVMEDGGSEDEAIGALLHDSIEDQGHRVEGGVGRLRADIAARFGPAVLAIVEGCTDSDAHPKPPWKERKEAYLKHLRDAPPPVRCVSCADKLHNARSVLADYRRLGEDLWGRFTGGRDGSLWYYRALADEFVARGPHPMADELERVVREIEKLVKAGAL